MARGHPDFGAVEGAQSVSSLSDLGEVVVRLGGISTYDRAGRVFFIEDFEGSTFFWRTTAEGVGGESIVHKDAAMAGTWGWRLTTGNVAGDVAGIKRSEPAIDDDRIGFELLYNRASTDIILDLYMSHGSGISSLNGNIRLSAGLNSDVLVEDRTSGYVSVGTLNNVSEDLLKIYNIKSVIDIVTGKYVRLSIDNQNFNVAAYDLPEGASSEWGSLIFVEINASSNNNRVANIDNIILTFDEP